MNDDLPQLTERDKQQLRRWIDGMRLADRQERERTRGNLCDPIENRQVYDVLWQRAQDSPASDGRNTQKDERAESRVAKAVAGVKAPC